MKPVAIIFFCLIFLHMRGQNLVPNPSFEEHDACPTSAAQLSKANPWISPNHKTPDLFHRCVGIACDDEPFVCVPDNFGGHQEPRTGDGYAGFYAGVGLEHGREYVTVRLLSPLIPNEAYVLTYYLSLGDRYSRTLNRIGAHFSHEPVSVQNELREIPQLPPPSGHYFDNETDWEMIRDTFLAVGGEEYLTIGNFLDEDSSLTAGGAYFYIDDVKLVPVDQNLYIKGDLRICAGESTTLTAFNGTEYEWIDSSNQWVILSTEAELTVSPEETSTYTVFSQECSTSVTVTVVESPTLDLGNDTTICEGRTFRLEAKAEEVHYRWQDHSSGSDFLVREAGSYFVELRGICPVVRDTILIETKTCQCPITFPTAFSPNDDGVNDRFFPVFDCRFQSYHLKIFDRWGKQVFGTEDPTATWDGRLNGLPLSVGSYVYLLVFSSDETNRIVEYGTVSLIR